MARYIDADALIRTLYVQSDDDGFICCGADDLETLINALPSAQKRGEWIKIDKYDKESNVQCSVCLEDFDYIDGVCYLCHGYELPLFCPNCGADMRGEENGELERSEDE